MAHGELHVPGQDLGIPERAAFADAHAVERSDDGVRQPVLLPRALGEVLGRELLEPVCRNGWGARELRTLRGGEYRRRLEHHGRGHDHDALQRPRCVGGDGRPERRCEDPLVLREQVERVPMEVADPADHRGRRDHLVASTYELGEQVLILCVTLDEGVPGMRVVAARDQAVLAEVIDADDRMSGLEQLRDQVPVDEPGGPGDQDPQAAPPDARAIRAGTTRPGWCEQAPAAPTTLGHARRGGQRPVVPMIAGTSAVVTRGRGRRASGVGDHAAIRCMGARHTLRTE